MISKDKLIDWLKRHRDYYHDGSTMSEDASHFGEVAIKEVIEHVEQLSDSLPWTTDKPTKEGFYWFRSKAEGPIVVRIYGSWVPTDNYKLNVWVGGLPDETDCNIESMEDGEWYGPLEIPS